VRVVGRRTLWRGLVILGACCGSGLAAEPKTPAEYRALAEAVAPALVQVEYTLQYDQGELPTIAAPYRARWSSSESASWVDAETLMDEQRPLQTGGYLVAPTVVVAPDYVIHPRFVRRTEVRFGDRTVIARPSAYAVQQAATFLQLEQPLPGSRPLEFQTSGQPPYHGVTYGVEQATWTTRVGPLSPLVMLPAGTCGHVPINSFGIVADAAGAPVGLAMTSELPLDDAWKGSPLGWPKVDAETMTALLTDLERQQAAGLVRATLNFRSPQTDAGSRFRFGTSEDDSVSEKNVTGIVFAPHEVLVLAKLGPRLTARLERITLHPADAEPVAAEFVHSLTHYGAFVARTTEPLPRVVTFSDRPVMDHRNELLLAAEVRQLEGKRVAYFWRQRFYDYQLGWRGYVYPDIPILVENIFLFDRDGRLVAFPVGRRVRVPSEYSWDQEEVRLTAVGQMRGVLTTPGADDLDVSNTPVAEGQENRLAWLGVELQALTPELARANGVSDLTQDGTTGALVTYVYPGSPAAEAGVQTGSVLLRLRVEGETKPLAVNIEDDESPFADFPWDELENVPARYLSELPPPWPSVNNSFTRALTDLGLGTRYHAEFFRAGEALTKEFTVKQGPPHFEAAPRHTAEELGVTVRDLTYEVRRFFHKQDDDPGVIVSKIEPGSKGAVAGLKPYEIITKVNDTPVANVAEFQRLLAGQSELRLSVTRMTRERLVRIKLAADKG